MKKPMFYHFALLQSIVFLLILISPVSNTPIPSANVGIRHKQVANVSHGTELKPVKELSEYREVRIKRDTEGTNFSLDNDAELESRSSEDETESMNMSSDVAIQQSDSLSAIHENQLNTENDAQSVPSTIDENYQVSTGDNGLSPTEGDNPISYKLPEHASSNVDVQENSQESDKDSWLSAETLGQPSNNVSDQYTINQHSEQENPNSLDDSFSDQTVGEMTDQSLQNEIGEVDAAEPESPQETKKHDDNVKESMSKRIEAEAPPDEQMPVQTEKIEENQEEIISPESANSSGETEHSLTATHDTLSNNEDSGIQSQSEQLVSEEYPNPAAVDLIKAESHIAGLPADNQQPIEEASFTEVNSAQNGAPENDKDSADAAELENKELESSQLPDQEQSEQDNDNRPETVSDNDVSQSSTAEHELDTNSSPHTLDIVPENEQTDDTQSSDQTSDQNGVESGEPKTDNTESIQAQVQPGYREDTEETMQQPSNFEAFDRSDEETGAPEAESSSKVESETQETSSQSIDQDVYQLEPNHPDSPDENNVLKTEDDQDISAQPLLENGVSTEESAQQQSEDLGGDAQQVATETANEVTVLSADLSNENHGEPDNTDSESTFNEQTTPEGRVPEEALTVFEPSNASEAEKQGEVIEHEEPSETQDSDGQNLNQIPQSSEDEASNPSYVETSHDIGEAITDGTQDVPVQTELENEVNTDDSSQQHSQDQSEDVSQKEAESSSHLQFETNNNAESTVQSAEENTEPDNTTAQTNYNEQTHPEDSVPESPPTGSDFESRLESVDDRNVEESEPNQEKLDNGSQSSDQDSLVNQPNVNEETGFQETMSGSEVQESKPEWQNPYGVEAADHSPLNSEHGQPSEQDLKEGVVEVEDSSVLGSEDYDTPPPEPTPDLPPTKDETDVSPQPSVVGPEVFPESESSDHYSREPDQSESSSAANHHETQPVETQDTNNDHSNATPDEGRQPDTNSPEKPYQPGWTDNENPYQNPTDHITEQSEGGLSPSESDQDKSENENDSKQVGQETDLGNPSAPSEEDTAANVERISGGQDIDSENIVSENEENVKEIDDAKEKISEKEKNSSDRARLGVWMSLFTIVLLIVDPVRP